MTTLENRPNAALLVVDVQNGVVSGNYERDAVVANIERIVGNARREQIPVIWIQDSGEPRARGSETWKIVPELAPIDSEPHVDKKYGDSFEETTLESVLSGLGVGRLFVVGAQTDACIRSTLHGDVRQGIRHDPGQRCSHNRGPDCLGGTAPRPGHRPHEPVLDLPGGSGRTAQVVETKDIDFGAMS
jgi:hypothetical protein